MRTTSAAVLALALLLAPLTGCVTDHPQVAPETQVRGDLFVSVYGDTLKLFDDSTYLVKSKGSNVWLGGRWWTEIPGTVDRNGYCGVLGVFDTPTVVTRCGGFWDLTNPKRLQDPTSVFFSDQVSRWWDLAGPIDSSTR